MSLMPPHREWTSDDDDLVAAALAGLRHDIDTLPLLRPAQVRQRGERRRARRRVARTASVVAAAAAAVVVAVGLAGLLRDAGQTQTKIPATTVVPSPASGSPGPTGRPTTARHRCAIDARDGVGRGSDCQGFAHRGSDLEHSARESRVGVRAGVDPLLRDSGPGPVLRTRDRLGLGGTDRRPCHHRPRRLRP
jgi:hypothetical protein